MAVTKENNLQVKKGFTLIELLVVISIVALLLAILMPSLLKARKQAQRVVCASNLRAWGFAIHYYVNDYGEIPTSFGYEDPSEPGKRLEGTYPNCFWLDIGDYFSLYPHAGQISHEAMAPYMPGFNDIGYRVKDIFDLGIVDSSSPGAENLRLTGAWACPLNTTDTLDFRIRRIGDWGYLSVQYAYYGRVDLWRDDATHPDEIPDQYMNSRQVLMADTIYNWYGTMVYNHGLYGSSDDGPVNWWEFVPPGWSGDGLPSITGINRLFGDGHTEWKDRTIFDLYGVSNPGIDDTPHVRGMNPCLIGTYY